MKVLGWLLVAAVVLALLRAALAVLIAGLVLLLVAGLWLNPQAVIGFVALCVVAGLVQNHPLPSLGLMALMTIAGMVRSSSGKSS